MIEILEYNLCAYNRDANVAEELMILRNEKELEKKNDKHRLGENDKILLAKLMVWAAYNQDENRITKYTNFIYRKLFGRKWYYNQVWMDQPINWLDIDLIVWVNGEDTYDNKPWTYEQLFEEAWKGFKPI